jgi:hypothetical protein
MVDDPKQLVGNDLYTRYYCFLTGAVDKGVCATIIAPRTCVTLSTQQTIEAASFLLSAAGIDLVDAARRFMVALEPINGNAETVNVLAISRERAEARAALAAELAKLDAVRT